jgi:uncharacterized protein with GYD domain
MAEIRGSMRLVVATRQDLRAERARRDRCPALPPAALSPEGVVAGVPADRTQGRGGFLGATRLNYCDRFAADRLADVASLLLPRCLRPTASSTIIWKPKGIRLMAHYLLQAAYTPEGWAAMIKNPQNRLDAVRPVVEKLGGKIESGWFAFGEYDLISIVQMPDNVSAAAFSLAATAGGAIKAIKTTPLLTLEEGIEAMKKAAGTGYKPPQGKKA